MIQQARKIHNDKKSFCIVDATKTTGINLPSESTINFDRAAFLFSVQDIDNAEIAIKNVADILKPKGEMVIFMLHPMFRVPRMSGWGEDHKRKIKFRRMDIYKTTKVIPLPQKTSVGNVTSFFYHRPLDYYINSLMQAGLLLIEMKEVYSTDKPPESEFPHFLLLRAKKIQ